MDLPPIRPQGSLTHYGPLHMGYATQPHLSRDWRFDEQWVYQNVERIPELNCIGPAGDCTPVAMALSAWTQGNNQHWREAETPGQVETTWLEYYDSGIYAKGTDVATAAGSLTSTANYQPNIALHLSRVAPPAGQGIDSQTSLTLYCQMQDSAGVWQDGVFCFALPMAHPLATRPFLHALAPRPSAPYSVFRSGTIVSWAPDGATQSQGPERLTWTLEYIPHPLGIGGWVLIRNSYGLRWLYHDPALRLVEGPITLLASGCRQCLNLTPVLYGNDDSLVMQAYPQYVCPLPVSTGTTWPATAIWQGSASSATGWTTVIEQMPGDVYRPRVSFTNGYAVDHHLRPIAWYCHETHAAAITSGGGTANSTQGAKILRSLSLSQNSKWRGATGTGEFLATSTAQLATWQEGGAVTVNLGWQTGSGSLAATDLLTAFIKPGGIKREVGNGDFGAKLTVEFQDFGAQMENMRLVDVRQGGGMYAGYYFRLLADALGVPSTAVDVAAACETMNIPWTDLPSAPAFAPNDGMSPVQFFDDVFTKAMGLRWGTCKDATHLLFLDTGTPVYVPGTSTIALHLTKAATDATFLRRAQHVRSREGFANAFKLIIGKGSEAAVSYWVEPQTTREAGIGNLWWRVLHADGAADAATAIAAFKRDSYDVLQDVIEFSAILRPDLKPDAFVEVDEDLLIGVPAHSIYQITESRPKGEGGKAGEHDFIATYVAAGTP